jgi:hypothetical protein
MCRAVVARGMATEKQSESLHIHYGRVIVHHPPPHLIFSLHFNDPTPPSLESDPIYKKHPEDYLFHEDGIRG